MKYVILALITFLIAACSQSKRDENLSGPVWIQVPMFSGSASSSESVQKYNLTPVQLFTLKNLKELSGLAARFYIDPSVEKGELKGRQPDFRYIRSGGDLIIPTDALSLQLATIYTHMEKLRALDEAAGAGSVNTWPRKVAVNAQYESPGEGRMTNNALYSGQIDAMVFVPYVQNNLPVMVNAGVIGHEHFHSLFYKLVILPLGDKYPDSQQSTVHNERGRLSKLGLVKDAEVSDTPATDRDLYQGVLLRGMNEGLADVWGWIYSGDVDFVQRSLPQEKINRRIDLPLQRISSTDEVRSYVNLFASSSQAMGVSYGLANQFARALKGIIQVMINSNSSDANAAKLQAAQMIVKALPALKEKIAALKETEVLSPAVLLEVFSEQLEQQQDLNIQICDKMLKLVPGQDEGILETCQKVKTKP